MNDLTIAIISDSTGETALNYMKSVVSQFPDLEINVIRKSDIKENKEIDELIETLPAGSLIIETIADKKFSDYLEARASENQIEVLDILNIGIKKIEEITGHKALREVGLIRTLSEDYFHMIEAIEFADRKSVV